MKKVRDILRTKPETEIFSITPSTLVWDALKLMDQKRVGALLVMENDELKGIFSERDYARKVVLMARSSKTAFVSEIMSTVVTCVDPDRSMEDCMELMTEKRIRHLPVIEEEKIIGVISIGDLVKNIIEDQRNMIKQLEQYIRGEI